MARIPNEIRDTVLAKLGIVELEKPKAKKVKKAKKDSVKFGGSKVEKIKSKKK